MSKRYGLKFVEIVKGMTREERLRALVRVLKVIHDRKLRGKGRKGGRKRRHDEAVTEVTYGCKWM